MRYEFHPDALAEYQAAAGYYADRQKDLEFRFITAVEHAIGQIRESPQRWPVLEDDVRRCLTRVFPYAVLYSIEADYLLIIAVMHCHREPGWSTSMNTVAAKSPEYWGARASSPAVFGVSPNTFPIKPRPHYCLNRSIGVIALKGMRSHMGCLAGQHSC
jgi:plasmid stabilization system protein ParE